MDIMQFKELTTNRLLLRRLLPSDWEAVSYLRSDPEINRFVKRPSAETRELAEQYILKICNFIEKKESLYWCISLKSDGKMIGSICLWNFSSDRKTAETGYDLAAEHQGKGIMTEALKAVIDFGFHKLVLRQIEAFTNKHNLASQKLLQKNAFIHNPERSDPDYADNLIYELKRNPGYHSLNLRPDEETKD